MPEHDAHPMFAGLVGAEVERASFPDGAVVQLVAGDPATGEATVVEVHPAAIVVTNERLIAGDGDLEWSWLLADIVAVHHGRREPWSIVEVSGVTDHGVSVQPTDVLAFRRALAGLPVEAPRPGSPPAPVTTAPVSTPPPPPLPPPPPPPAAARLDADLLSPHALVHHTDVPDTHADDAFRPHDSAVLPAEGAAAAFVTVADLHSAEAFAMPPPPPAADPTIAVDLTDGSVMAPLTGQVPVTTPEPDIEVEGSPRKGRSSRFRGGAAAQGQRTPGHGGATSGRPRGPGRSPRGSAPTRCSTGSR